MNRHRPERRYNRRVAALAVLYAGLLSLHGTLGKAHDARPMAWITAMLPALPILGIFWALGRYLVEETDEYVQSQTVRQIIVATGLTLSLTTVWGFLESDGLVPHVDAYFVAALWFAGLGLGALLNRLRA